MNEIEYIYLLVRRDLGKAQTAVQTAHALYEVTREHPASPGTPHVVLLEAESESALHRMADRLKGRGIKHHLFYEPDFGPMGYTALATQPIRGSARALFRGMPLLQS